MMKIPNGLLRVIALQVGLAALAGIAFEARAADTGNASAHLPTDDELTHGDLYYGITTTVFKLQSSRHASEPARSRNYTTVLDKLPLDVGFQFTWRPKKQVFRRTKTNGGELQLVSFGGLLSVTANSNKPAQSQVTLAFVLSFFNERVSAGLGFDLFRGIPVRGADGVAGSDTASTGLLGWAWSSQGEITAENLSFLLMFNIAPGKAGS